ncbi:condensation domain-containing protein [Nocardia sp. NPDC127579]|uniref:condensation domain-containing protein n=1 Tax=Nocardia sp. NPDC127579 TaxID=3345402 RepID=UPI003630700B
MDIILAEDWTPKPGVLLEFTPDPDTLARVRTAGPSTVPATYMQESHIRRWAEQRHTDNPLSSELAMCFTVASPLNPEALRDAFTAFLRRHETLRTWFSIDDTPWLTRYLLAAGEVELMTTSAAGIASSTQLRDRLAPRFRAAADPTRWPAFVCAAIDHGSDGFTVVYSIDHAFSDGTSLVAALFELYALYGAYAADQEPVGFPVGSYVEFAADERAAVASGSPELDRLARLLADNADRARPLRWDLGLAPGELADSASTQADLLERADVDAFAEACAAAGATFSAGLFAALARTELELYGQTHYLALNVLGTRNEPRYQFAQGWFVNLTPISFDVSPHEPFDGLATRVKAAQDAVKPLAAVPIHAGLERAAELTGSAQPRTTDWPWVSYMDMRAISDAALRDALPQVGNLFGLASRSRVGRLSPLWFNRETDRLRVAMVYPDTLAARSSAEEYFDRLRDVLAAVARSGEFTADELSTQGS